MLVHPGNQWASRHGCTLLGHDGHVHAAFPLVDPVGPAHVALPNAVALIADRITGMAEEIDRQGVPRTHWDSLATAQLLPVGRPSQELREITELLAGSDASTWFCWAQHATPTQLLAGAEQSTENPGLGDLRDRYLGGLQSGKLLAATAFAHVRRPGPPNPVATRTATGWLIQGRLDWVTSWDIADLVQVMVRGCGADSDRLVCFLLPAGRQEVSPGVVVEPVLELMAMGGTHTRPLHLQDLVVDAADVIAVLDAPSWQLQDAQRTAHASAAIFGVIRGSLAELHCIALAKADAQLNELSQLLVEQCRSLRERAYVLADAGPLDAMDLVLARRLRAEALQLAVQAATVTMTQRAGAGMRAGCSAERRIREAMFLQVQAQTLATREAMNELALQRLRATGKTRGTEIAVP